MPPCRVLDQAATCEERGIHPQALEQARLQLRLLREERLVAFGKEGRMAYYRLMDRHVTGLIHSAQEPG